MQAAIDGIAFGVVFNIEGFVAGGVVIDEVETHGNLYTEGIGVIWVGDEFGGVFREVGTGDVCETIGFA